MTRTVSILCASRRSVYHTLDSVDVYDAARDARTFRGDTPIVAHPPCRAWSAFCAQQAKPEPGEMELGLWCCDMLRQCGGILEHPAHSRLYQAAGLPLPGERFGDLWTMEVWQAWWGYPCRKATWLCFAGVPMDVVVVPYALHASGRDRRRMQVMSHRQRAATTREFAEWLVGYARLSRVEVATRWSAAFWSTHGNYINSLD